MTWTYIPEHLKYTCSSSAQFLKSTQFSWWRWVDSGATWPRVDSVLACSLSANRPLSQRQHPALSAPTLHICWHTHMCWLSLSNSSQNACTQQPRTSACLLKQLLPALKKSKKLSKEKLKWIEEGDAWVRWASRIIARALGRHRRCARNPKQKMRTAPMQGDACIRARVHHTWTSASSQVLSPPVSIHSATVSVHTAPTKETRTVSVSPTVSQCLFIRQLYLFTTPLPQLQKKENKLHSLAIGDQWIRAPNSGLLCLLFVNQVCPPLIFVC